MAIPLLRRPSLAVARWVFILSILLLAVHEGRADPYKDMAKQLGKMGAKHLTEKKLAILPFDYADKRSSPGGWSVAERLIGRFVERGDYTVVERSLVEKVLGELKFQSTGVIDPETAQKIGRGLGVPVVVTGTMESLPGGKVRINARMIEVETLKIVGAVEREAERTWSDQPGAGPAPANAEMRSLEGYSDDELAQIAGPSEVATVYAKHLRRGRWDKAYSLLTEKARSHISPEEFATDEARGRDEARRTLKVAGFSDKEIDEDEDGGWELRFSHPVSHESGDFVRAEWREKGSAKPFINHFWLHSEAGRWWVADNGKFWAEAAVSSILPERAEKEKAASLASKACEIVPVDPQAWAVLSGAYSALAQDSKDLAYYELAVKNGREAVRLDRTSGAAWIALGNALLGAGSGADAEEAFTTVLSLDPAEDPKWFDARAEWFRRRANARFMQGKLVESLKDVRAARALAPANAELKKLEEELGKLAEK